MEEIVEFLRENNEAVINPLDLPDHEDLVAIEEEILMPIPFEYREFLLSVSDVVYGKVEPATAADPRSHTYLSEMTAYAWDIGLSREYLPVCEYDQGYACVDQDGQIFFWKNGELTDKQWETIWHWVRDVWVDGLTI